MASAENPVSTPGPSARGTTIHTFGRLEHTRAAQELTCRPIDPRNGTRARGSGRERVWIVDGCQTIRGSHRGTRAGRPAITRTWRGRRTRRRRSERCHFFFFDFKTRSGISERKKKDLKEKDIPFIYRFANERDVVGSFVVCSDFESVVRSIYSMD